MGVSEPFFGFRPDHPGRSGTLLCASLSDKAQENQKTCEVLFRHSEGSWAIRRFSFCRHWRREMGFQNDLIRFSSPVYMLLWFPVAASLLMPLWLRRLYSFPGSKSLWNLLCLPFNDSFEGLKPCWVAE